jgi:hypothetical protein
MNSQIDRVIAMGKPIAVIQKLVTAEYLRLDKTTWMRDKQEEYSVLFPATREATDAEYEANFIEQAGLDEIPTYPYFGDGSRMFPLYNIKIDYSEDETYVSFTDWLNETRIITEAVEATYDEDGMILTEAVAEVTELVHPYVAKDVTDRVDAYIRQATLLSVVTMRQARLALLQSGLLATIETAITTGTDEAMKIEWEYATEIKRDWNSLVALTTALGMTSAELDDLFQLASTL